MGVEVVGDGGRLGAHRVPVVAAVGVELRGGPCAPGCPPGVFMVSSVVVTLPGAPRLLQCRCSGCGRPSSSTIRARLGDDLRRRHLAVAVDRVGELLGVLAPLPGRDAAGVDRLDAVDLGRPDQPGDDVLGPLDLAGLEQVHARSRCWPSAGSSALSTMGVSRSSSWVCLADRTGTAASIDGRPAHAGVEIAGGEGRRRRPADAGAAQRRVQERVGLAMVFRGHGAGEVDGGAGDVGVDVHAAGEDDHAGRVDRAAACPRRRRSRPSAMQMSLITPLMPLAGS